MARSDRLEVLDLGDLHPAGKLAAISKSTTQLVVRPLGQIAGGIEGGQLPHRLGHRKQPVGQRAARLTTGKMKLKARRQGSTFVPLLVVRKRRHDPKALGT
jgi:hypothetical protein